VSGVTLKQRGLTLPDRAAIMLKISASINIMGGVHEL